MYKQASPAGELVKSILKRTLRTGAGAAAGAGMTYGLNKATGADEWSNNLAATSQYGSMATLGALAAQPGAGRQLWRFLLPKRSVGGTSFLTNLIRPHEAQAPTRIRNFSPARAMTLAAMPGAAYGIPLLMGAGDTPLAKLLNKDIPDLYSKALRDNGKSPDDYSVGQFLLDKFGDRVASKISPIISELGNKAIEKGEPLLKELGEKGIATLKPVIEGQAGTLVQSAKDTANRLGDNAWKDTKPYVIDAVKDMGPPIAGSLIGSGLGWLAGSAFYSDDDKLTPEERMEKARKQDNTKILLSVLGGTAGSLLPAAPAIYDILKGRASTSSKT